MATCIAVDAMGGDNAPEAVVDGAIRALRESDVPITINLYGPEDVVQDAVEAHDDVPAGLRVVDAPDVIGMAESPASAVKRKQKSSIHRGLGTVKQGGADAFLSAGNTGAIMAASMFILGRVDGVDRPSIAGYFPTLKGSSLVLDIGSNVDCKPAHLVQFAQMGTAFAREVLQIDNPSVGLLNIGEEPGKGNEQAKQTHERLQGVEDVNFIGNIEGSDLLFYASDIILCDGFVGNILLKFGESMSTVLSEMAKQEMERQGLSRDEQALVAGVLGEVRKGFDPEAAQGGAPLLGVNGNVLIGHGSSSPKAIAQLIFNAVRLADRDVPSAISSSLVGA